MAGYVNASDFKTQVLPRAGDYLTDSFVQDYLDGAEGMLRLRLGDLPADDPLLKLVITEIALSFVERKLYEDERLDQEPQTAQQRYTIAMSWVEELAGLSAYSGRNLTPMAGLVDNITDKPYWDAKKDFGLWDIPGWPSLEVISLPDPRGFYRANGCY